MLLQSNEAVACRWMSGLINHYCSCPASPMLKQFCSSDFLQHRFFSQGLTCSKVKCSNFTELSLSLVLANYLSI